MVKFSDAELERITRTIAGAELKSAGEIRVVVARSCTRGRELFALGLAVVAAAAGALVWWKWEWGHPTAHGMILAGLVPAVALYVLTDRLLRRPAARAHCVERRAMMEFVRQGVAATRDRTGILILLSVRDRRVHILADSGINARVPPSMWSDQVATIVAGLRSGRACEHLCQAIAAIGAELVRHFPRRSDDANELPDRPVIT